MTRAPTPPGPSAEMQLVDEVLRQATAVLFAGPFEDQRRAWEAAAWAAPDGTVVSPCTVAGVPAERVVAPGAAAGRVVVHFHGGGYAIGSPRTHRALAAALSSATGAPVVVPDYRLAPEHRFPAAVEDAVAVATGMGDEVGGAARVVLSGDSAGAGLVLACLLALRQQGRPLPAAGLCWSPWVELAVPEGAGAVGERDAVLSVDWLTACSAAYLGGADPADPLVSPLRADLAGLPPLLVQVSTEELLVGEARRLVGRAEAAGVAVELVEYPGAVHIWPVLAPSTPEAAASVERAGAFAGRHLPGAA